MSRAELVQRMKKGLVTVIDVRPEDEFALGHLPGAHNIPLSALKRHLAKLDRKTEIIAYCRDKIANYKAPRKVEFIAEIPKTANGKIYKKGLRDE